MSLRRVPVLAVGMVLSAALTACRATVPAPPAPPVPSLPSATPTPAPTATPAVPARLRKIAEPGSSAAPSTRLRPSSLPFLPDRDVRVLLAEGAEIRLPDPGRRYRCESDNRSVVLRGPLVARQDSVRVGAQAGAFASVDNARRYAAELRSRGFDASLVAVPGGLQRVMVVGKEGESAGLLRTRLMRAGVSDVGRPVAMGGQLTVEGEGGARFSGASVALIPVDPDPVRFGERRFRGSFRFAPATSGVRLINVLSLETYLRGVVPAEMGPRAFPALEALKAQAVAARTYTIAHLGERAAEGYDICATQACQVYEGVGAEHPLTDRAISETAGEILLWQGRPIDAMYHSTCAGRTEDASAVLPERAAPYLVGVPCRGEQELRLGAGPPGSWLGPVGRLDLVAELLGKELGLAAAAPAPLATALTGLPAKGGLEGLTWTFGLDGAVAMLHGVEGLSLEERVQHLLATFRVPLSPRLAAQSEEEWQLALVVRLAQIAGRVEAVEGRLVPSPTGPRLIVDRGEDHRELGGDEVVLERRGDAWRRAEVIFPAGSDATLWCVVDRSCPVLEVEPRLEADDRSAWGWWVREVSLREIGSRVGVRNVKDVSVTRRGKSGRASAVSVVGDSRTLRIDGYRFRMSLGLPDTLFVVSLRETPEGAVAHFVGRGWGHGIGMCQNGAYGLAQGGADHESILTWYYTGAVLAGPDGKTGGVDE